MIFLADIPGNLIFLIVVAAVGVINWWLERKKRAEESQQQDTSAPSHKPLAGGESEQERLRRFLEALGVPQQHGGAQPPPQAPEPPARPAPVPRPVPAPRPAAEPRRAFQRPATPSESPRTSRPRPVIQPPRPVPARVPVHEPEDIADAGRLEEPATAIESIAGEFERMNVGVTMQPIESLPDASIQSAPATVTRRANAPIIENLRLALRTPSDLRTAVVTMEILGPPKGLHS